MTGAARQAPPARRRTWTFLAALLLGIGVLAFRLLRGEPSDLTAVEWVAPSPAGDWIALSGRLRFRPGDRPVFFENPATGAFVRAGYRMPAGGGPPVFSADGRTAAWAASRLTLRGESGFVARALTLDSERPGSPAWDGVSFPEAPLIVFSDDGSRLAFLTGESLSIRDARTGRVIVAARPAQPLWPWGSRGFTTATFVTPDLLRVYRVSNPEQASRNVELDVLELDAAARRLSRVGHAGPFSHVFPLLSDARRERLLVRETARAVRLLDARSGETLRVFAGGAATYRSADFLSDGRIALLESEGGQERLNLLDASGALERRVSLGPGDRAFFVGEPRAGLLDVAAAFAANLPRRDARIVRIDLTRGTAATIAGHLFPVTTFSRWTGGDPGRSFAPGSLATRLFYGPNDSLVELDPRTRRPRTVLGGPPAR